MKTVKKQKLLLLLLLLLLLFQENFLLYLSIAEKIFFSSLIAMPSHASGQILDPHRVGDIVAWTLQIEHVDVFLLLDIGEVYRKDLFILYVHVDRHIQTFEFWNVL